MVVLSNCNATFGKGAGYQQLVFALYHSYLQGTGGSFNICDSVASTEALNFWSVPAMVKLT